MFYRADLTLSGCKLEEKESSTAGFPGVSAAVLSLKEKDPHADDIKKRARNNFPTDTEMVCSGKSQASREARVSGEAQLSFFR